MFDIKIIDLISVILINALSIYMAFLVYIANRKEKINIYFALLSATIILWIDFGYLGSRYSNFSLILTRANIAIVPICFILFNTFTSHFSNIFIKNRVLNYAVIFSGIIFTFSALVTNTILTSVTIGNWGTELTSGYFMPHFYLWVGVLTIFIIYKLIFGFIKSDKYTRSKLSYFLTGFAIFTVANIIINILFPSILNTTKYYKLGDYSIIFFLAFTAYSIVKKQLFNIRVIATEISVVVISLALLIEVFLSSSVTEGAIIFLVWAIATYGGYQLIKSVKREIKQKEDLAKLAKQLEEANAHLKELDQLKDDFLSMAAHELNTPIAAIEGYLSMILDEHLGGEVNPKIKRYLENMFSSSKRLAMLVHDMLNVSRIESGRIHIVYTNPPLEDLITQAIAEINSKARERKHTLVFKKPAKKLPATWLDTMRVTEVMINLMGNAIKYTDPGGHIEVNASADDKYITVSVKDNGRGIPEDRKKVVFEKFSQVDILKDEVKGTGLGMYIAKKFIELHKGKIWFDSTVGKGTTFYFTLPILDKKPFDPHEGEGEVLH